MYLVVDAMNQMNDDMDVIGAIQLDAMDVYCGQSVDGQNYQELEYAIFYGDRVVAVSVLIVDEFIGFVI